MPAHGNSLRALVKMPARRAGTEASRTPDPVSRCVCTGERAACSRRSPTPGEFGRAARRENRGPAASLNDLGAAAQARICHGHRHRPSLRRHAAGDCEHTGASGHRADPRAPRPGPAVARSGASEPGAATSLLANPIQRDTREAGASTGGFGLAPRRAPVASAFLATPGRFAGTIERRWLAMIAQDQMRTELRPHRPSQPLQYACHRAFKITILRRRVYSLQYRHLFENQRADGLIAQASTAAAGAHSEAQRQLVSHSPTSSATRSGNSAARSRVSPGSAARS